MPAVWYSAITRLVLFCAAGFGLGWWYGNPMVGLFVAVLAALLWNLMWLYRLDRWLHGEKMPILPDGSGVWSRMFARMDFLRGRDKRRSKRVKALVKQMRQATRSFPDGGIIITESNEIVTLNKVAEALLGLKRKRDRGLRLENLVRDPDFVNYLRDEISKDAVEFMSPIDHDRWLECHQVAYGLEQKLLLIRDITPQRQADQMRRDFIANASHELRTPLTVVTGYLDALADDPAIADELQQPLEEMQRQTDRMRSLVDELLRLSELEAKGLAAEGRPVNLPAIIAAAGQEAKVMEGCPRDLEIQIETEADIQGDERDIQSVLSNLVSNAVRYTPTDGRITIAWSADESGGLLSVTDTGPGIGKEHLPRLTERFYRVENGRERMGGEGGTGLGLAIVKHALQRHSADLQIESEVGQGSRFTCKFPKERLVTVA